ncbi:MAG: S8 family serine peptidase, partial [Anaerolineae bacterium]|nr:S8 family serine peptidase [Anaerolineae bacterium]
MKRRAFFLLAVAVSVGVPAGPAVAQGGRAEMEPLAVENFQPVLTFDNQGPAPKEGRLMVQVSGPVTEAVLAKLAQYGTIHGVIERYHIVVITPRGPKARRTIESLPFVSFVEEDQPRWLTGVGSWDRDILDVVDVEETGDIGAPDPREVAETGAGVHVAVIDTGLIKRWRDFLHTSQVRTDLARAFMGGGVTADLGFEEFNTSNPTNLWERDTNSHGTAVASHIIGFKIGPHVVEGVAPDAQVIPLKVFPNGSAFTFASRIIAAIAYTTELKEDNVIGPTAMNISIAGGSPSVLERAAIQDAIAEGIVVVASAGNLGEDGMGWPGAFPEVISVGATGWVEQFLPTVQPAPDTTFWRTRDVSNDPDGSGKSEELQSFVATFSSRAIPELGPMRGTDPQELDVLAPGLWTVAPCLLPGAGGGNA